MFGGDDEDGDFLSPTGGAKLASLFGLDQETSRGNESFQYTAPKQPRKSSNSAPTATQKSAPPPGAPAVLLATAVQAFRYIDGQYAKQGKLGAAVLGNHTTKEYKLLLYLSQQKQVTAAKIHVGFVFTVQPNNYCTFYDDQRQNWSLMFESEKAASDFCKEVCLAKANSTASLEVVVMQDLSLGEGPGVENGDSLEVVYTGWLLQNHTMGQMFDSNQNKEKLLRLKLGSGKVIKGWEEGMLAMKKAGSRLIVIPPSLAYGAKGVPKCIPANSTLIFEVELRRVKFFKDSSSDRASASSRDSAAPSPAPSPAPSVENLAPELSVQTPTSGPGRPGDPPLRAKSNSLSEQLANPDATKAKLISRMAKMGQPMLPFLTGVASQLESSDSELEDTSGSRVKDQPAAPSPVLISTAAPASANAVHPHPHTAAPSALVTVLSTVGPQPQPTMPGSNHAFQPYPYTQTSVAPAQLQPVGQVFPAQTVPYMGSSDVTSFMMTEARQHNTEIRLAVGKVADKVDQLAAKVDNLQRQGSLFMGVSSMSVETSMIVHNIQRIVQENECLKKEVFDKSSRIEEQNHKIGELINQNQRYMEQSNLLLEQRNDSLKSSSEHSQARLLQAEQDKVRLTDDLASSTARLSRLQLDASTHQQKAVELQSKLNSALQDNESQSQHIAALGAQLEELKEAAEKTQAQYRSEKQRRKEMELKVNNAEEELQDLKADKEGLQRTLLQRKEKWQDERRRWDKEMDELRKSNQQELDNLRDQLCKSRTSTTNSEQLSQLRAELEDVWKGKSEQMLASAKEQHSRELAELTEQRDALQDKVTQLQEKFMVLKQSRDLEEQSSTLQQAEELQALKKRCAALEQQEVAVREKLETKVSELESKLAQQQSSADTTVEVKRVMNGVFHSLREEFDLSESYSGQAVLSVIVTTIKNVTLQLLSGTEISSPRQNENKEEEEEEEEEEDESDDMKPGEEELPRDEDVHENGEREKVEVEYVAGPGSPPVRETQIHEEVAEIQAESETQSHAMGPQPVSQEENPREEQLQEENPREEQLQEENPREEQLQGENPREETPQKENPREETPQKENPREETPREETPQKENPREETPREETPWEETPQKENPQKENPQKENPREETPQKDFDSDANRPADSEPGPDESPSCENGQETLLEPHAAVSVRTDKQTVGEGEMKAAPREAFGPPANPPPPPDARQTGSEKDTSTDNGEEMFFQITTPAKPPAAPSEEEEEDEMSLKGRPPPAPLFGDDEDDDDLDWLS